MINFNIIKKRVGYLKKTPLFSNVDSQTLKLIASEMQEQTTYPMQVIIKKGDLADNFYIIVEGSYKVHDNKIVLNILKDREFFGEYSLIDKNKRAASVTCISKGRLLILSSMAFSRLLENNINITLAIMKSLVLRIKDEKDKSEKLLQNILPYEVSEELKTKGKVDAKNIEFASVLFIDFSDFTRISMIISAEELIEELNYCFTRFDDIISKYNLERIKTIGDAYMCAEGVIKKNVSNPVDTVLAAIEIRDFMNKRYQQKQNEGKDYWQFRIGINTGSLIAGIVGVSKFSYDIWGDTVNTASRIENNGAIGKINISESTYENVKKYFDCEYIGIIKTKGKGSIKIYGVTSRLTDK